MSRFGRIETPAIPPYIRVTPLQSLKPEMRPLLRTFVLLRMDIKAATRSASLLMRLCSALLDTYLVLG